MLLTARPGVLPEGVMPRLPELAGALATDGSADVAGALARARKSGKLVVTAAGGSVTAGSGVVKLELSWVSLLEQHLQQWGQRVGVSHVEVRRRAIGGVGPGFMATCVDAYLEDDTDLLVLEYAINYQDASSSRGAEADPSNLDPRFGSDVEQLLRHAATRGMAALCLAYSVQDTIVPQPLQPSLRPPRHASSNRTSFGLWAHSLGGERELCAAAARRRVPCLRYRDWLASLGLPSTDASRPALWTNDRVHPSQDGSWLLFALVASFLEAASRTTPSSSALLSRRGGRVAAAPPQSPRCWTTLLDRPSRMDLQGAGCNGTTGFHLSCGEKPCGSWCGKRHFQQLRSDPRAKCGCDSRAAGDTATFRVECDRAAHTSLAIFYQRSRLLACGAAELAVDGSWAANVSGFWPHAHTLGAELRIPLPIAKRAAVQAASAAAGHRPSRHEAVHDGLDFVGWTSARAERDGRSRLTPHELQVRVIPTAEHAGAASCSDSALRLHPDFGTDRLQRSRLAAREAEVFRVLAVACV